MGGQPSHQRLIAVAVVACVGVLLVVVGWVSLRSGRPLATAGGAPTAEERGPGPSDDVVLLGDSITEMSQAPLTSGIGDGYRMRIRGRGGYRTDQMEPYAVELSSTRPEQVVVNLGTNDVLQQRSPTATVEAIGALVDAFPGARCVHVVTVNERIVVPEDPGLHPRIVELNAGLRAMASSRGIGIVDWSGAVAAEEDAGASAGPLTSDTVHPTARGQALLAELYREALDRCPT